MPDSYHKVTESAETRRHLGADHKHDLEVIDAVPDQMPGAYRVVRWCKLCGAVVVDLDYDGRTSPGAVVPMKFPGFLKDLQCPPS